MFYWIGTVMLFISNHLTTTPLHYKMKILVLTLALIVILIVLTKAQSVVCTAGFQEEFTHPEMFTDPKNLVDFTDPITKTGLHWWFYQRDPSFYVPTLNKTNKSLDVALNIKANRYEPINISFGNVAGTTTPKTMDFSNNFDYELVVKNTGTTAIIVRFGANDSKGTQLSLNGEPSPAKAWAATIQMVIAPGKTGILTKGTPNGTNEDNLGTFLGCSAVAWNNGVATILTDFDYTNVTGVNITVIDGVNNPPKNLKGSLQILKVRVGDVSCLEVTGIEVNTKASGSLFYPNPVKEGRLHLRETMPHVQVFDSKGHLVTSAQQTDLLELNELPHGLYHLKTTKGSSSFLIME